ncbi:MAG: hypothetical protein IPH78_02730 [Bacteroidetes bacterium]|nr:hypothetical protein [Bacteroidota bacterium]
MISSNPKGQLNLSPACRTDLNQMAHAVADGIYGNPGTFAAPPVTQPVFEGLLTSYHNAYEDYKNGGKNQKGAYLVAKNNLMGSLDQLADYVDALPGLTEATIYLAGFTPTKVSDSKAVVPAPPVIKSVTQGSTGSLVVEADAVPGAEYYGCLVSKTKLDGNSGIIFFEGNLIIENASLRLEVNKGRKKTISNLQPKEEYWFYMYAGNSAGVSALSAPMSRICL